MKIISKYKDYYDYYQGVFGMDNTKVYTRKDVKVFEPDRYGFIDDYTEYAFYICGIQYTMYEFKDKFYHTPEELMELDKVLKEDNDVPSYRKLSLRGKWNFGWYGKDRTLEMYEYLYNKTNGVSTDENVRRREPILVQTNLGGIEVPLLESFEFYKVMDAETLYIEVERFLGWLVDNPPLPDTQTNVGKIEGHGFDKKTSFRPKMKKR